jgi:ribonuclease E
MLIDASHPEETRVVVLDGQKVEEFDFEAASKRPLKGNIYLAKVTRVEPSLQAAFVEYGGNRQGFLAFSEIHPDYYQIPVADRMAILAAQTERMMAEEDFDAVDTASPSAVESASPADERAAADESPDEHDPDEVIEAAVGGPETTVVVDGDLAVSEPEIESGDGAEVNAPDVTADLAVAGETFLSEGSADTVEAASESEPGAVEESPAPEEPAPVVQAESTGAPSSFRRREEHRKDRPRPRRRQYKIQEVIKRRQVMLVQVVKEERGNKGASLTTFLSLAGRYCVLMPNTPRGGGISRKITNATDRKRLKSAAQSLELPEGMGLIIRTAGANRTKAEIKRDYEYLIRLWDTVRELTLKSNAPALVYEEGSLIKRAIRDLYNKEISEVLVDGDAGYRDAKDFMRMLMPSHAKNVKLYKDVLPLFQRFQVEAQLDAMFSPVVTLKSGGYIVINQTEALVSIDVNSGKATREHSIEETAHKTNLEAADEISRQLRLRDLAGLIVIDFIDMEDSRNDRNVEKRLYNAVRGDRARIQIGKISQFGLLEMSRQRLRAGVLAGSTVTCPHCAGMGLIRSTESAALRLLRALDEEGQKNPAANIAVKAPPDVTIYTLNQKRREIVRIEEAYDLAIAFEPQATMMGGSFEIERTGTRTPSPRPKALPVSFEAGFEGAPAEATPPEPVVIEAPVERHVVENEAAVEGPAPPNGQGDGRRRRRRRRRGGRGRGSQGHHEGGHDTRQTESFAPPPREPEPRPVHEDDANVEGGAVANEQQGGERTANSSSHSQPQAGEGGQHRRRRRRRGRRGRHREGEHGNGGGFQQGDERRQNSPQTQREEAFAGTQDTNPGGEETMSPNAPSSPQWTLNDMSRNEARSASPPSSEHRVDEPRESLSREAPEPAERNEPEIPPEDASPREARKGWWQRRFKM